jgi:xanthine/CO dehydrogenase XdhC/CoxF family maturation factor
MDSLLLHINQALKNDEEFILVTLVQVSDENSLSSLILGNKRLILNNGDKIGTLGEQTLDLAIDKEALFSKEKSSTISLWTDNLKSPENVDFVENVRTRVFPKVRVAIEIIRPQPSLLICGAGHIARALTKLGTILGFRSIVIDDRVEFASRDYFPDLDTELKALAFQDAIESITLSQNMSVVIVTRGHKHDEDCLRLLLGSKAGYIGMIGSRRRIIVVKEKLLEEGFTKEELSKIYAPIGLDIGAKTPEEIALAILAEIVLVRNRGKNTTDSHPLSRIQQR